MYRRILLASVCLLLTTPVLSFQCYLTVVKDSCWKGYEIRVTAMQVETKQPISPEVVVPKDKMWARAPFNCKPSLHYYYQARYSPAIWAGKNNEVLYSKKVWMLPADINKKKAVAWNINVCYQADFASLDLPPTAKGKCRCDLSKIPEVKPPKSS